MDQVPTCCGPKPKGVANDGFVEVDVTETEREEFHHENHHRNHKHHEEIGLDGLQYKPLCHCEEVPGRQCACRTISARVSSPGEGDAPDVRFEVWGRWKCVALSLTVALTCVWLVVYISLHYTNVI